MRHEISFPLKDDAIETRGSDRLERSESPIFEPGLDGLVCSNAREGRLSSALDGA